MLPQRITRQAELTPFLTHCSGLFLALSLEGFAPKKHNSFAIKQIQFTRCGGTLSPKHPGWGYAPHKGASAIHPCLFASSPLSTPARAAGEPQRYRCHRFACPLFSERYESLFPQPLSLHIYTNPRGVLGVRTQSCTQNFNCRLWTFPIPRGRAGGNTACPLLGLGGGVGAAGGRRCVLRSRFRRC